MDILLIFLTVISLANLVFLLALCSFLFRFITSLEQPQEESREKIPLDLSDYDPYKNYNYPDPKKSFRN